MSKVDFLLSSFKYRAEKMSVFSSAKNHQIGKALLETLGLPLDPWSSVFIAVLICGSGYVSYQI